MILQKCVPLVVLLTLVGISTAEQFSFKGYQVWLVTANNEANFELLSQWQRQERVDFWEPLSRTATTVRVMVKPSIEAEWLSFLEENAIPHKLIIEDVDTTIKKETNYKKHSVSTNTSFEFDRFWAIEEINEYIDMLERDHSDIVSVEVVGNSTQDRPLRIIYISLAGRGQVNGSRPIIFVDAGIQGREWLSHHIGLYVLSQLIENRTANKDILEAVDFVIIPNVNPDGYRYSRFAYRMWTKTMREFDVNEIGLVCYGVNGNRNYEYMWKSALESNVTTCNETYPGTAAFSEAETRAVQFVLDRHSTDIKMYLSFNTYGQFILYPYGSERALVDNWYLHEEVGRIFADTILAQTGTNYTLGNAANLFGEHFGTSIDYASFVGVQAAFTIALPGGGSSGFDVPENEIVQVLNETWTGLRNVFLFAGVHNWEEY